MTKLSGVLFLLTIIFCAAVLQAQGLRTERGSGQISGTQWIDQNGNGIRDAGEPGLSGTIIMIDNNYNGRLDPGEQSTQTSADGSYTLTGLPLETQVVAVASRQDFASSTPRGMAISPKTTFAADEGPRIPTAADLDGDGLNDLVVSNVFSDSISIMKNVGDGTFNVTSIAVEEAPRDVLAEDLDADGDIDLAISNMDSATVSILINTGRGNFAPPVSYQADDGAWIVEAADFDKDGDLDLAVTNQVAATVTLLSNLGDGTFVFAGNPSVGTWPHSLGIEDVDGDGSLDIVTANLVSNDVSFLLNRGNGLFFPSTEIAVGNGPLETTFADLDGDGIQDLIVENLTGGDVSVLAGLGSGNFAPPVQYPTGAGTHDVDVIDLDFDGDLDLVASAFTANTLSVLKNPGDGNFEAAVTYPTGDGSLFIEPHDYDRDGDIDLLINNIYSNDVSLFLSNGDGTFASAQNIFMGEEPRFITTADLNNDGRRDFVSANLTSNDVSVVYNVEGHRVIPLGVANSVENVDFGSRPLSDSADEPSSNHTFKIRVGEGSHKSATLSVGQEPVTIPVLVRRFLGEGAVDVNLSWGIVDGNPDNWQIHMNQRSLILGAPLTNSTGDVDDPGVRANELGDGDVDQDDVAAFFACQTGAGVPLLTAAVGGCIGFDFDGDLDIDITDRNTLLSQLTGSVVVPWNQKMEVTVQASQQTAVGEAARFQIIATRADTGESRSVFVRAKKRPYQPSISTLLRFDITKERSSKLLFGGKASFELSLANLGADDDNISVSVEPRSGFDTQIIDLLTGQPRSEFEMEGAGPIGPQFPLGSRPVRLDITAGPRTAQKTTLRVVAQSLSSNVKSHLDLEVIKVSALWSPSNMILGDGRRHRVLAANKSSHGFIITNTFEDTRTLTLAAQPVSPGSGWTSALSTQTVTLEPGEQAQATLTLRAPNNAVTGSTSDWYVSLLDGISLVAVNQVGSVVTDDSKVIFIAVDGLSPSYLNLNAAGTAIGSPGDWLMPSVQRMKSLGTTFTNVNAGLPSYTDPNHVAVISGSAMGKNGVGNVIYYYYGVDKDGASIVRPTNSRSLKYGPNGDPVETIYDVAKTVDPNAYTAFLTGKNWMSPYLRSDTGGADMLVDSFDQPFYVDRPLPHVIGDPPSDTIDPPLDESIANWGNAPGLFPSDEFIMQAARSALDFEDPDVMYILLAGVDDVGHMLGAAWKFDDWDTKGTATTFDDINQTNPRSNREEILDEVREADVRIGELLDDLETRGILDDSYLVLVSDHGMVTFSPHPVELDEVLEQAGYGYKDDYECWAGGSVGHFFGIAPEELDNFESVLENAPPQTPGFAENPWLVINQQEMLTGVDSHTGTVIGEPGELYSDYFINHASADEPQWPQLLILLEDGVQLLALHYDPGLGEDEALEGDSFSGGHAGRDTAPIVLVMTGPQIAADQQIATPVSNTDIAPTLYNFLGWPAPGNVEGATLPEIAQ